MSPSGPQYFRVGEEVPMELDEASWRALDRQRRNWMRAELSFRVGSRVYHGVVTAIAPLPNVRLRVERIEELN